jgi:ABC-type antimicrobial peptide transport system ATPase subunit
MAIETEVEMVKNAMAIATDRLIVIANRPTKNRAATNLAMRRALIDRKPNANRAITLIIAAIEKESHGLRR